MKAKRKIKLITLSVFCFFLFKVDIKAATEDGVCTQMVADTRVTEFKLNVPSMNRYRGVWRITVGDKLGFCLNPGVPMTEGTLRTEGPCGNSGIERRGKQAVQFCSGGCSDTNYILAQFYVWTGNLETVKQAYCSLKGFSLDRNNNCFGFNTAEAEIIFNKLKNQSVGSDAAYSCWNPGTNKELQRIISAKDTTCRYHCPEGTEKAGLDITQYVSQMGYEKAVEKYCGLESVCIGYEIGIEGGLAACRDDNTPSSSGFHEYVARESATASGSLNGRKQNVNIGSGKYCALYCLEDSATAKLPGGFANAIALGSAITWPTSEETNASKFGNMFPVLFRGKKTCVIQVAPNLTYGNSCKLEPIEAYKEYLADMKNRVDDNDNINAISSATNANRYRSGHGAPSTITAIPNTNLLNYKNEQIRKYDGITTYFGGLETYSPADGKYFSVFLARAEEGVSKANSNYEHVWQAYCKQVGTFAADEETICNGGHYEGSMFICDNEKTKYSCPDGSARVGETTCRCTEEYANNKDGNTKYWKAGVEAWETYSSYINRKYSAYSPYIKAYKNATSLYQEIKYCGDYTFNCSGSSCAFYDFQTSVDLAYEDENGKNISYGSTYPLEIEKDVNYTCDTCSQKVEMYETDSLVGNGYNFVMNSANVNYFTGRIEAIEGKVMNIDTGDVTYKLPDGLYNYIDKDTNEFKMSKPSGNYITLGLDSNGGFLYSNLPTSFNNKVGKKYELVLNNISLGDNGQYNAVSIGFSDYVCHYEVKTDSDDCLCPPGTKNDGVDLYQVLLDSNGNLTCADAKKKYCDADNVPECKENCVAEKYCDNDPSIKITSCLNSGKSKSECETLLCNRGKYICNDDTKMAGMDMTSCVQTRMAQGYSESASKKYCNRTVCEIGNLFIYRTIDLRNPFPSIDADSTVSQNNLRYGMFNLNVKGRYPGYNWNGTEVVKTEIIQNRDVSNYDVYNQKPLYHFELDTSTIMDIREYNRKQAQNDDGYNDFTLECVTTFGNQYLGTACLSSFVHDPKYGGDTTGTDSLCGGAGTTTTLANCLYKSNGN